MTGSRWTESEDGVLRAKYLTDGPKAVAQEVGRSVYSVYRRACTFKIARVKKWTEKEDDKLRINWNSLTIKQLSDSMGRTECALYERAVDLKLTNCAPQGSERLSEAIVRTGYDVGQIRRMLAASGYGMRPVTSRRRKEGSNRKWLVDSFDLDTAIEAWEQSETVNAGALRRGFGEKQLRTWLVEAGHVAPGPRQVWRVPTVVIDELVAAKMGDKRESLREAGDRTRIRYQTLSRWLKEAGLELSGKPFRVEADVVDRIVAENRKRKTCRSRGLRRSVGAT
jgi:hypothetical protein